MAPEHHWRNLSGADFDVSVDPADIVSRAVTWQTWPGVLAVGEVTILVGLPNMGKSTLARLIAAKTAQGRTMPNMLKQDDDPELHDGPAKVLWVSMEENPSYTIKPGLEVAGVPPDGWRYVNARRAGEGGQRLTLDEDGLKRLGYMADKHQSRLIVLDGTDAFVPDGMSPNRGEHVSEILNRLGDWAAESSLSVLLFRHEGKASRGRGIESGTGSIQWQAGVRLSFILEHQEKGDTESPINLAATKDNLAPTRSIEVRIEPRMTLVQGKRGLVSKSFGFAMLGDLNDIGADKMVSSTPGAEAGVLDEAMEWITATLAAGPMRAKDVFEAGGDARFKERTLKRAKKELGIKSRLVDGSWLWMPNESANTLGPLGPLGTLTSEFDPVTTLRGPRGPRRPSRIEREEMPENMRILPRKGKAPFPPEFDANRVGYEAWEAFEKECHDRGLTADSPEVSGGRKAMQSVVDALKGKGYEAAIG